MSKHTRSRSIFSNLTTINWNQNKNEEKTNYSSKTQMLKFTGSFVKNRIKPHEESQHCPELMQLRDLNVNHNRKSPDLSNSVKKYALEDLITSQICKIKSSKVLHFLKVNSTSSLGRLHQTLRSKSKIRSSNCGSRRSVGSNQSNCTWMNNLNNSNVQNTNDSFENANPNSKNPNVLRRNPSVSSSKYVSIENYHPVKLVFQIQSLFHCAHNIIAIVMINFISMQLEERSNDDPFPHEVSVFHAYFSNAQGCRVVF